LYEVLELEISKWEDTEYDELTKVFEEEYSCLTKLLADLRYHPGTRTTGGMKDNVGSLRKRLTVLRSKTKTVSTTHVSAPTDDSKSSGDT